jgi:hypothetical protein
MSSKLFVGGEFFAFSFVHTQACIGHHDLVSVNFEQVCPGVPMIIRLRKRLPASERLLKVSV